MERSPAMFRRADVIVLKIVTDHDDFIGITDSKRVRYRFVKHRIGLSKSDFGRTENRVRKTHRILLSHDLVQTRHDI